MIQAEIRKAEQVLFTFDIPERLAEVPVARLLLYEDKAGPLYPDELKRRDAIAAELESLKGRGDHPVALKRRRQLERELDELGDTIEGASFEQSELRPFLVASVSALLQVPEALAKEVPTQLLKQLHAVAGRALDIAAEAELNVRTWVTLDGTELTLPPEEMRGAAFIEWAEAAQLMHTHAGKIWTPAYHVACVLWRPTSDTGPYTEKRYFDNLERLKTEPATILAATAFFLAAQAERWLPMLLSYLPAEARARAEALRNVLGGTSHFERSPKLVFSTDPIPPR